jgi:hypothetical protein
MLAISQRHEALLTKWDAQLHSHQHPRHASMVLALTGHTLFGRLSGIKALTDAALIAGCVQVADKVSKKKKKNLASAQPAWLDDLAKDPATRAVYHLVDDPEHPNSISRFHFHIRACEDNSEGFELRNLGALNGVYLNDAVIRDTAWHPLSVGDTISFAPKTRVATAYHQALDAAAAVNLARSAAAAGAVPLEPLWPYTRLMSKDVFVEFQLMPVPIQALPAEHNNKSSRKRKSSSAAAASVIDLCDDEEGEEEEEKDSAAEAENTSKRQKKITEDMDKLVEEWSCCICTQLQVQSVLLGCGHGACKNCMIEWFNVSRNCPLCRAVHEGDLSINQSGEATIRFIASNHLDDKALIEYNRRAAEAVATEKAVAQRAQLVQQLQGQAQALAPRAIPVHIAALLAHHAASL